MSESDNMDVEVPLGPEAEDYVPPEAQQPPSSIDRWAAFNIAELQHLCIGLMSAKDILPHSPIIDQMKNDCGAALDAAIEAELHEDA